MTDKEVPSELVSISLVPGIHPCIPIYSFALPRKSEKIALKRIAGKKMIQLLSRARIRTYLHAVILAASKSDLKNWQEVVMFRESPTNKWMGLYVVVAYHRNVLPSTVATASCKSRSIR